MAVSVKNFTQFNRSKINEFGDVITTSNGKMGVMNTNPSYILDVDGTIHATGDVIMFSDARYKTNIEPIENVLSRLAVVRGVTYEWKKDEQITQDKEYQSRHMGVIAQDVQRVFPEAVHMNPETGNLSVAYPNLVGALVEGINILHKKVQELTEKVQELTEKVQKQET